MSCYHFVYSMFVVLERNFGGCKTLLGEENNCCYGLKKRGGGRENTGDLISTQNIVHLFSVHLKNMFRDRLGDQRP